MNPRLLTSFSALAVLLAASLAGAVVAPTDLADQFPLPGSVYESLNGTAYGSTIPTEMISMSLVSHPGAPTTLVPPLGESFNVDSFFDIFIEVDLGGGDFQVDSFFDVFTELSIADNGGGSGGTRTFDTEMISMSLSSSSLGILLRESPTLPSPGQHTVTSLPGGNFQVDSFFDIWTEVSIDGGLNWSPAGVPVRAKLNALVPEPATLAILALGGLATLFRKRR